MLGVNHRRLLPLLTTLALLYVPPTRPSLLLGRLIRLRLDPRLPLRLELLLVITFERDTLDENEGEDGVDSDEADEDEEEGPEAFDVAANDPSLLVVGEIQKDRAGCGGGSPDGGGVVDDGRYDRRVEAEG